ncbi:cation:proton antiporter [Spongisporangium articulatum]|uniref:Cation:proton antiporter n=1 Tax=Spongisporangium articulatum TaxID=3362603 RepID=A0ABW8AGI6_9ACTN
MHDLDQFLLPVALVTGVVVLTPVAERVNVPHPVLLLIYGLLLPLLPGLPDTLPQLQADWILPAVLPPLLFAATQRTTVGQFRDAAAPVALLAVGLTVASGAVAAVAARACGLSWTAAVVLGAILSPPDPVAATAVARRLRLPERLVTVLEGEGMFNDATALVMYKVALAVAVTGEFSAGFAVEELLLALVVGVVGGLVIGWLTTYALGLLHDAEPETTVTLAAPFVAYLGVEEFHGSGVLAVLTLGLFLRSKAHPAITARGWLLGRSVWEYADFLITGLVFVLLGYELTASVRGVDVDALPVGSALVVIGALVLLRPLYLFPGALASRAMSRRREAPVPIGWRETAVASWAGMRGVVTVATALALPVVADDGSDLAWRTDVVLIALAGVLVTLLGQGLTLSFLVRRLGVGDPADEASEVRHLQMRALEAAVATLQEACADGEPGTRAALAQYEGRLRAQHELDQALTGDRPPGHAPDPSGPAGRRYAAALRVATDAEREVVLSARARGEVSPATADTVLGDVEGRAARLAI